MPNFLVQRFWSFKWPHCNGKIQMKALYQLYTYYLSMSVCVAFSISIFLTLSFLWVLIFLFMYCNIVIFLLIIALGPAVKSGLHFLHSCVSERWPYQVLTAELANAVWILIFCVINPRPEGYGSRFVVHSVHRATESSVHFFAPVKVRTG